MLKHLVDTFKTHQSKIDEWFAAMQEQLGEDPVYASVDLRNAGYKVAPVDTNIFPAGFNNLCPSYRREAGKLFLQYMQKYHPDVRRIAILAEEHTRNLFYFENLFMLSSLLREVGFEVEVASLSNDLPHEKNEFETSGKNHITVWKAKVTGFLLKIPPWNPDLILVNNDFSVGLPPLIKKIVQPMAPTPLAGWHARKKSDHFAHYQKISQDFARLLDIDPWLISAKFRAMAEVDFTSEQALARLATKVDVLLSEIRPKFHEYKIKQTPYVFIKNDAGTYGMAITTVESGDQLMHLNKKERTRMKMGKGLRRVREVIIQEGVPTVDRFKGMVAEPVIYLIGHRECGGFFRLNETKDDRSNLNQPGMQFTKLCFHELMGYSNEYTKAAKTEPQYLESLRIVYKNISRIASLAAGCEIKKINYEHTLHY